MIDKSMGELESRRLATDRQPIREKARSQVRRSTAHWPETGAAPVVEDWLELVLPGSKLKSNPSFGKALSVNVSNTPYSLLSPLSRTTAPSDATQLVRSR